MVSHFDGATWTTTTIDDTGLLTSVWGSGPDDVWAVGRPGAILHNDGTGWQKVAPAPTVNDLADVFGFGPDDVWAVGINDTILHFDGDEWTAPELGIESDGASFNAVWGAAPDDVWFAAGGSKLLHYDGATFTLVDTGSLDTDTFAEITGTGADDVWIVGQRGLIRHFDGSQWTSQDPGPLTALLGVWTPAPGTVWAVGDNAILLRQPDP